ncbi:MAG: cellulase family glycosylhydrolase [Bacteroidota bacterium]
MRVLGAIYIYVIFILSLSSCGEEEPIIENPEDTTKVWSVAKAKEWGEQQGWIVGANFIPSNAGNQLEMWQDDTWSPELIDTELGYAESIGMNTVRVYLHYFPYRDNKTAFFEKLDKFLELTDKHGIKPMLIFFDDVWDPDPVAGPQGEPTPGVHNSMWLQSPGSEILWDIERHDEVKPYVIETMTRYKDDDRVLLWDLYNEPQNTNGGSYRDLGKEPFSLALLKKVFSWAREVNPSQPITSAVWAGDWSSADKMSEFVKTMIFNSDVVSFHSYENTDNFKQAAAPLLRMGRPVICSEYMARHMENTIPNLVPYMHEKNIGAINWGLVAGRSQTIYPWWSWDNPFTTEPNPWFHDLLHTDGTPYDQNEIDVLLEYSNK